MSKGGRGKSKSKSVSGSSKAGLQFPVGRIAHYLKAGKHGKRVSSGAPIYLKAGVLEYLAAEVPEHAGNGATDKKKKQIVARHIKLAVGNDEELCKLLADVTIAEYSLTNSLVHYVDLLEVCIPYNFVTSSSKYSLS